jgi:Kinesin motor domain
MRNLLDLMQFLVCTFTAIMSNDGQFPSNIPFYLYSSPCRVHNTEIKSFVHLVDLAGSEAVGKAGNQGSLKLEGISINQGLLALSNCIRAVIQKSQHIPVRNTALTIVLQGLF